MLFAIPALVTGVTTVAALVLGRTKVVHAVAFTIVASELQKKRGHRAGEGPMSKRADGHPGVKVSEDAGQLGASIHSLIEHPDIAAMQGLTFELTLSEGKDLARLVSAARNSIEAREKALTDLEDVVKGIDELQQADLPELDRAFNLGGLEASKNALLEIAKNHARQAVLHESFVVDFLKAVPQSRVKKGSG